MPEFINTVELAAMLRHSPETIRYWRWKGTGPKAIKVGRLVLYDRADVLAWIESERAKQAA
jgi:predicted DNA-binding transcriptional regulator AlpA